MNEIIFLFIVTFAGLSFLSLSMAVPVVVTGGELMLDDKENDITLTESQNEDETIAGV